MWFWPVAGSRAWVADLVGPVESPLVEISGGSWRTLQGRDTDAWPPVNAQQEKRKFLLRAGGSAWLIKFAGLGPPGRAKLDRARALNAAGVYAARLRLPPRLPHRALDGGCPTARSLPRRAGCLIDQIGRYLGFRARLSQRAGSRRTPRRSRRDGSTQRGRGPRRRLGRTARRLARTAAWPDPAWPARRPVASGRDRWPDATLGIPARRRTGVC